MSEARHLRVYVCEAWWDGHGGVGHACFAFLCVRDNFLQNRSLGEPSHVGHMGQKHTHRKARERWRGRESFSLLLTGNDVSMNTQAPGSLPQLFFNQLLACLSKTVKHCVCVCVCECVHVFMLALDSIILPKLRGGCFL